MMTITNEDKKMFSNLDFRSVLFWACRMSLFDQFECVVVHISTPHPGKWRIMKTQVMGTGLVTVEDDYQSEQESVLLLGL